MKDYEYGEGFVWLVGRRIGDFDETTGQYPREWHIQGVAGTEKLAIAMCRDETYFIGPLPLNALLPHDRIEWTDCYFPLKRGR